MMKEIRLQLNECGPICPHYKNEGCTNHGIKSKSHIPWVPCVTPLGEKFPPFCPLGEFVEDNKPVFLKVKNDIC